MLKALKVLCHLEITPAKMNPLIYFIFLEYTVHLRFAS